ncbi:MAG TPA: response regulator [bacterium]|nr:response regulator [bacterium]
MVEYRNVVDMKRPVVRSVIIADDDRLTRSILRSVLTRAGYSILGEAETGLKTAVLYEEHHPDILLLDIDMPGGSGITILRLIREMDRNARVIMLTGDTTPKTVSVALRLGAKDYVSKSSGEERLLTAIRKTLGQEDSS